MTCPWHAPRSDEKLRHGSVDTPTRTFGCRVCTVNGCELRAHLVELLVRVVRRALHVLQLVVVANAGADALQLAADSAQRER